MARFTVKQGQYLAFIRNYTEIHRRPPAQADMQAYFGVTAPSVHQMVLTLERRDLIQRAPGAARSIRLTVPASEIPALGAVADRPGRSATTLAAAVREASESWPNIEWLIDGEGEVTVGTIGGIRCAATAADSDMSLAMLVRRPGETLAAMLSRLDEAIREALEDNIITDEINA